MCDLCFGMYMLHGSKDPRLGNQRAGRGHWAGSLGPEMLSSGSLELRAAQAVFDQCAPAMAGQCGGKGETEAREQSGRQGHVCHLHGAVTNSHNQGEVPCLRTLVFQIT